MLIPSALTCISAWWLFGSINAAEVVFPPIAPIQAPLLGNDGLSYLGDQRAYETPRGPFPGSTFANLPYVQCLESSSSLDRRYDIAFLGAPFDTAVTGRPGARFGPTGIRLGSRRIDPEFDYDFETGENPFKSWARIVDCGDAPLTVLDNTVALKQLDQAHKTISSHKAASKNHTVPRIVTLGGDHTTTLSALRSVHDHWGRVSVIHFDSHIDTWDPKVLGGGISHYAGVNHGTFLHIAASEGLLHNHTSIHAGIRAPVNSKHGDARNDRRCGFATIHARDIDRLGVGGVVKALRDRVAGTLVYVSVDIDALDPAFAPATGTAEVGGWSSRELLAVLDGLSGVEVVGADVVEVSPIYDNPGEPTALAAAEVAKMLMTLMVRTPVDAKSDKQEGLSK